MNRDPAVTGKHGPDTESIGLARGAACTARLLETDRLVVRRFAPGDATFLCALLNDPSFIRFIGDRDVRDEADARTYIADRILAAHAGSPLGPYLVELRETGRPVGLISLLKRDWLEDVDLGFALLAPHRGNGYAFESASAAVAHARSVLGLNRLVAFTDPDNSPSMQLLVRLGFTFERMVSSSDESPPLLLFSIALDGPA